jgi:hypothetical protein
MYRRRNNLNRPSKNGDSRYGFDKCTLTVTEYGLQRIRNIVMDNRFKYSGKDVGNSTRSATAQTVMPFRKQGQEQLDSKM